MRIGELSRRAGVSIPTIKYYMRDGLLPPGEREGPNQAQYGERHVHRLRLIRALIEVGRLSVADTRALLDRLDEPGLSVHSILGRAQYAITPARELLDDEALGFARDKVDGLLARQGWSGKSDKPALQTLIEVIATFHRLGQDDFVTVLDRYAEAAKVVAEADLRAIYTQPDTDLMTEGAIVGTILGDVLLGALRRLAQEDTSRRLFGTRDAVPRDAVTEDGASTVTET